MADFETSPRHGAWIWSKSDPKVRAALWIYYEPGRNLGDWQLDRGYGASLSLASGRWEYYAPNRITALTSYGPDWTLLVHLYGVPMGGMQETKDSGDGLVYRAGANVIPAGDIEWTFRVMEI
jgi:hypothetical protein